MLRNNNIEMYSTHNERKSVVAERFMRKLKNRIDKHMIAVLKNVYFDVSDILLKNTVTQFIELLKWNQLMLHLIFYAEYNSDSNEKELKFKVSDHARIPRYQNIIAKGYTPNWSEESFTISKIKNTVPWTDVISDLNGTKIDGTLYEQELQKQIKKNSQ